MKKFFDLQLFADTDFLKDNLQGFVPVPIATQIIQEVTRGSSVLRLSNIQQMTSETQKFPVYVGGAGAYWIGETERIKTTAAKWIHPEIVAKKIAVIIPVTREKLNDTTIDVFAELRPYIAEAFYKTIDEACLFGKNSPYAKSIYSAALSCGNAVADNPAVKLDLAISDVMALVEDKGFDINGFVAGIQFKNSLRKLRDANGNQLYVTGLIDANNNRYETLYSLPVEFGRNGAWDNTKALCIGGNWKYSIVGIREQIQFDILREATLENVTMSDGKPLSLAEQDMVGIRATMRIGFLPVRDEAFAMLVPAGAATSSTDTSVTSATTP